MVTVAEITGGFAALKAALDVARGLNAANTQAGLNEIKITLQQHILNAQEALTSAREATIADAERIRELEREIERLRDWESEKQRYELRAVSTGAYAYALKVGLENGEPPHWLCANCYQRGKKSILQRAPTSLAHRHLQKSETYDCPDCKAVLAV